LQDHPVHPSRFHEEYSREVAKYKHLEGTQVEVVAVADKIYKQQRPLVYRDTQNASAEPITYHPSYNINLTHPGYGTTTFTVTFSFAGGKWFTGSCSAGTKIYGGKACKGGPAGPVIVQRLVERLATQLWRGE
jgi:hypothetical protein